MSLSTFDEAVAAEICERLTNGETLEVICADEGMPNRVTVWRWQQAHEAFRNDYARACELSAHALVDEAIEAARDTTADHAPAARVHIDTLKWAASRRLARVYGDKLTHSNDPDSPIPPLVILGAHGQAESQG